MKPALETRATEVTDPSVQRAIEQYRRRFPWADLTALGVHLAVLRAFSAIDDSVSNFLAPFGLSRPRFTILRILFLEGRKLTMTDISKQMNVTTTNITKLVDVLERQGLVTRVASPDDRRVVHAQLTEEGEALAAKVVPDLVRMTNDLWAGFSAEEQKALGQLLTRFRLGVEGEHSQQ